MGLILGYNACLFTCSDISLPSNNYYRLELQNAIFDTINGFEDLSKVYSSDKDEWSYDCIINGEFRDDLEAGNIDVNGQDVKYILFQKRKIDELQWNTIAKLDYDKAIKLYRIMDYYIENAQPYEYCIIPLAATVQGDRNNVAVIIPDYDGIWLTDSQNNVQLLYNLEQGDIEFTKSCSSTETLGGRYPITNYSGNLDYKKGTMKAMVVSDASASGKIDIYNEKINRNNIINFLKSWKPKLYRNSSTGEMMMIATTSNPKFSPNNDLSGQIGTISFDFQEAGDTTNDTDMRNNGFIE